LFLNYLAGERLANIVKQNNISLQTALAKPAFLFRNKVYQMVFNEVR